MSATAKHLFSTFDVTRQVFFKSSLSLGIVNLKPLLPGRTSPILTPLTQDILLIPRRVVPRLSDLNPQEIADLFSSVQLVGRTLEKAYKAQALTISVQDGVAAGQSVPHIHVHIIPRRSTDFGGVNDEIYPALEGAEKEWRTDFEGKAEEGKWAKDEDRKPRSMDVMEEEAKWLAGFFECESISRTS